MKKQHLLLIAGLILVLIAANVALKPKTVTEEAADTPPATTTQDEAAPASVAPAEPTEYDPKAYDYSELWQDPIRSRLLAFIGAENYVVIRTNLEVVTPIKQEGDWRIFRGIKAHEGGTEEALLWVNGSNNDLLVYLLHNSTAQIYYPDHLKRSELPAGFVTAIVDMNYNKYSEIYNAVDTSVVKSTEELPEGGIVTDDNHAGHDH